MTIAKRLLEFLKQHDTRYKLVAHPHTGSSMETAEQAHVLAMRWLKVWWCVKTRSFYWWCCQRITISSWRA